MASIPLIEEQVEADFVVLNVEKVGLTDEQFVELCADNREFQFELTAQKELVIMTPPGGKTGRRHSRIHYRLADWAERTGQGVVFAPGTLFQLPNGAKRALDGAWVSHGRWDSLTDEQQEKIPPICPEFVLELMSPSDRRPVRFRMLQAKMNEYIANGAQLGWLVDPFQKKVYIYRPGEPVECLDNPGEVSGDPVLPGFVFQFSEIWQL